MSQPVWGNGRKRTLPRRSAPAIRPDGTQLATAMSWPAFQHMADEEVSVFWLYLQSVPAKP